MKWSCCDSLIIFIRQTDTLEIKSFATDDCELKNIHIKYGGTL